MLFTNTDILFYLLSSLYLYAFFNLLFYVLKDPLKVNVSVEQEQWPEGSDITISCHVDGYPIEKVQWYKDEVPLETNNHIRVSGK